MTSQVLAERDCFFLRHISGLQSALIMACSDLADVLVMGSCHAGLKGRLFLSVQSVSCPVEKWAPRVHWTSRLTGTGRVWPACLLCWGPFGFSKMTPVDSFLNLQYWHLCETMGVCRTGRSEQSAFLGKYFSFSISWLFLKRDVRDFSLKMSIYFPFVMTHNYFQGRWQETTFFVVSPITYENGQCWFAGLGCGDWKHNFGQFHFFFFSLIWTIRVHGILWKRKSNPRHTQG